jgi:GAF domain-containing protein
MALRLSSLGRLVRTIVPRAQLVAIFDPEARISWATDAEDHEDLRALAAELLASAGHGGHTYAMRCELDSAASYAFLMQGADGAPTGVLALTVAGPFRRAELLRPAALQARLAPLLAQGALAAPDSIEREIAVLASRVEAEAVIACVPGERFCRSHRLEGSQLPGVAALQRLTRRELAIRTSAAARPLRVDKARIAPDAPTFGFVSVPLARAGRVIGVLAVFATQARRPFSAQDAELVTESAERLAGLLGRA